MRAAQVEAYTPQTLGLTQYLMLMNHLERPTV